MVAIKGDRSALRAQPHPSAVRFHATPERLLARRQYGERPRCGDEMQHSAVPDRHLLGLSQPLATPAAPKGRTCHGFRQRTVGSHVIALRIYGTIYVTDESVQYL